MRAGRLPAAGGTPRLPALVLNGPGVCASGPFLWLGCAYAQQLLLLHKTLARNCRWPYRVN